MPPQLFVNLPVRDITKTKEFFSKLDFKFNPQYTDQNGACLEVGRDSYVMLLPNQQFKNFTSLEIPDTRKSVETIVSISADSRSKVDEIVNRAVKAGGQIAGMPQDQGGMYGRGFRDLDGHHWEVFCIE
jgi:uncharacterized protein